MSLVAEALVHTMYGRANAGRWRVPTDVFAAALDASAARAFAGRTPAPREVESYLAALHLEDLALACACAAGDEAAWEHFVREHRPLLYRAADAIDPGGGARDLADSLYADLFGLKTADEARQSLFRYFHGRSSLATWLRAILAQRHVDRVRASRRTEPLPDDDSPFALAAAAAPMEPERDRYVALVHGALHRALAQLPPRDRLRLACYYEQQLTLAQTGRVLREHEATASRHLARTRQAIKRAVEHDLRLYGGLGDEEIAGCVGTVLNDAGSIDLNDMLNGTSGSAARKKSSPGRSD